MMPASSCAERWIPSTQSPAGGASAAGAAGAADYLTIPSDTQSKKVANIHGALNLGIMGLYSLNLALRSRRRSSTGIVPFLLSAAGTAGLIAASWYGGELVYELGMRVKPLMKGDESPELKLPGDEKVHLARAAEAAQPAKPADAKG